MTPSQLDRIINVLSDDIDLSDLPDDAIALTLSAVSTSDHMISNRIPTFPSAYRLNDHFDDLFAEVEPFKYGIAYGLTKLNARLADCGFQVVFSSATVITSPDTDQEDDDGQPDPSSNVIILFKDSAQQDGNVVFEIAFYGIRHGRIISADTALITKYPISIESEVELLASKAAGTLISSAKADRFDGFCHGITAITQSTIPLEKVIEHAANDLPASLISLLSCAKLTRSFQDGVPLPSTISSLSWQCAPVNPDHILLTLLFDDGSRVEGVSLSDGRVNPPHNLLGTSLHLDVNALLLAIAESIANDGLYSGTLLNTESERPVVSSALKAQ